MSAADPEALQVAQFTLQPLDLALQVLRLNGRGQERQPDEQRKRGKREARTDSALLGSKRRSFK